MLKVEYSTLFKKDYKRMIKRGCRPEELEEVVTLLMRRIVLPKKYCDHALTGDLKGFRECHINPDWLLMYEIYEDELVLVLARTGTHNDLFG